LSNADLTIKQEVMGTMESVNAEILSKTNPNDSLVGMAEVTENKFIYSEKSWANPTTEIDIEQIFARENFIPLDY